MEFIQVGKISNIHGNKGEVKVIPLVDNIERFNELEEVYLGLDKVLTKIDDVAYSKGQVIINFQGVKDVETAKSLIGKFLWIDIKDAKKDEDAYFLFEIIGLKVLDTEDREIGKIKDILQTGANDVYVVKQDEKEHLIPAVKEIVKKIDLEKKIMIIDPIEGLIE